MLLVKFFDDLLDSGILDLDIIDIVLCSHYLEGLFQVFLGIRNLAFYIVEFLLDDRHEFQWFEFGCVRHLDLDDLLLDIVASQIDYTAIIEDLAMIDDDDPVTDLFDISEIV